LILPVLPLHACIRSGIVAPAIIAIKAGFVSKKVDVLPIEQAVRGFQNERNLKS
jgi:hypothetical protein